MIEREQDWLPGDFNRVSTWYLPKYIEYLDECGNQDKYSSKAKLFMLEYTLKKRFIFSIVRRNV